MQAELFISLSPSMAIYLMGVIATRHPVKVSRFVFFNIEGFPETINDNNFELP